MSRTVGVPVLLYCTVLYIPYEDRFCGRQGRLTDSTMLYIVHKDSRAVGVVLAMYCTVGYCKLYVTIHHTVLYIIRQQTDFPKCSVKSVLHRK